MWIKVCGVRDAAIVRELARGPADLRPDALGLNFFAGSPRCLALEDAETILAEMGGNIESVGVFVNASLEDIRGVQQRLDLSWLQLHGDEPPELLADLRQACPGVRLLRAVRVDEAGLADLENYLQRCQNLSAVPDALLVDARVDGHFGGTGQQPPWDVLVSGYRRSEWPRLVLAGGLSPDNVVEAISVVQPWGVDVASGVESAPAVKSLDAVTRFVENARSITR